MNHFFCNIFKAFLSNGVSLLTGVLVGFFIPKMMGVIGYANFKIYTLYLTYLALTSLGLGDGLYLRHAGKEKNELDPETIRYYTRRYYAQLLIFFICGIIGTFIFIPSDYHFVVIALCFTIFSSQVIGLHQNFSILTNSIGEYSNRIVIKSICTAVFVLVLYVYYKTTGKDIRYEVYILGIIVIEYVLAIWYVYMYREFNFGKAKRLFGTDRYFYILYAGFPLLLSNMAGTIFLNIDRQFVSVLCSKETYAIYAFAYNMLTLVTTMTAAVSIALFPSMKRISNFDTKTYMQKYLPIFTMLVTICMVVYYPMSVIVNGFLEKYIRSIEVFRIILPGLILSSSVTVIFFNFYKIENKVKQFFLKTAVSMVFAIIVSFASWNMLHDYRAISWGSIISQVFWYALEAEYFVRKYTIKLGKISCYAANMFFVFYGITATIENPYLGTVVYLVAFALVAMLFYPSKIKAGWRWGYSQISRR